MKGSDSALIHPLTYSPSFASQVFYFSPSQSSVLRPAFFLAPCSLLLATALFPLLDAVSIAASGCPFWVPFGRPKSLHGMLLILIEKLRDRGHSRFTEVHSHAT